MIYYPSHTMRQRASRGGELITTPLITTPLIELMRHGCAVRRVRACTLQRIDTAYRYELHDFAEPLQTRPSAALPVGAHESGMNESAVCRLLATRTAYIYGTMNGRASRVSAQ